MQKLLLPLIALMCCSFNAHQFYVSNTLIEYSTMTQTFGVTCRVFTDDLERAINAGDLHIGEENEPMETTPAIEAYLRNHFKLWFNDQPQNLVFIGKETENDMTLCYFEMMQSTDFHSLKIENTLLLETFPAQKNIVEISSGGKSQTLILTGEKTSEIIFH